MVRKEQVRQHAILLRRKGKTYPQISQVLGGIPKGTLSYWLRGVPISLTQRTKMRHAALRKLVRARQKSVVVRQQRRKAYFEDVHARHTHILRWLEKRDIALLTLATLYLAEGGKTQRGALAFGNSDPGIIRRFLQLLRFCYIIDEAKFRCTVQCRADQSFSQLERFWSRTTRIPHSQFYTTRVDPRSKGKRTQKIDYKGVCKIDYFSAQVFHELMVVGKILTTL